MAEKGIAMTIDEARQSIAEVINNLNVPFCIIEPILKDFHDQAVIGARQELDQEQKRYEEQLQEEQSKEGTDSEEQVDTVS